MTQFVISILVRSACRIAGCTESVHSVHSRHLSSPPHLSAPAGEDLANLQVVLRCDVVAFTMSEGQGMDISSQCRYWVNWIVLMAENMGFRSHNTLCKPLSYCPLVLRVCNCTLANLQIPLRGGRDQLATGRAIMKTLDGEWDRDWERKTRVEADKWGVEGRWVSQWAKYK